MKEEIVIPRMGESITEATIGRILKPDGSFVNVDEEIVELDTEKVNQLLYAPAAGAVHLTVKEGDSVKIGQRIGFIDTDQKAPEAKQPAPQKEKTPPPQEAKSRIGKEQFVSEIQKKPSEKAPASSPPPPAPPPRKVEEQKSSTRTETREKLPKIRQVIAARLVEAQKQSASLTTFNEVDLTQVILLRERYKDTFLKEYNVKLGYMPFFVKASVSALEAYPEVNAYLDGEDLVYRNYCDISIAVSTDKGLVVPVVRDCDQLSFAEIEQAIDKHTAAARKGTLSLEDLQGGGFTITNGGVFGSLLSTPILNPPQTAILGMHKIQKRPVAINDQVLIRPMMYLALTYDHRVIDGKTAVSFLVHIKQSLEDPSRILLEI